MMESINCPVLGCSYSTPANTDAAVVATLLNAHTTTHNSTNTAAKVEKVKRPTISTAGSSEEWAYFETRWDDYKTATRVTGHECVVQLLECCDESLRKDLTRAAGGSLTSKSETDVLAAIRLLAVRDENTMVARVTLHNMRQDRDEPIRNFGARLRGQAGVCKFFMQCPGCSKDVNYTDEILRDVVTRGIVDTDVQLDLLGDCNQNMTLEEVLRFVEAKEAGKRSASRLISEPQSSADAMRSSYKKNPPDGHKVDPNDICSYCGKTGHGKRMSSRIRSKKCPAFIHTCRHCDREHHFDNMCRSRSKPKDVLNVDREGAIFDSLCASSSISPQHDGRTLPLDHHMYNEICDQWSKQTSQSQPFIKLQTTVHSEDYAALGFKVKNQEQHRYQPWQTLVVRAV